MHHAMELPMAALGSAISSAKGSATVKYLRDRASRRKMRASWCGARVVAINAERTSTLSRSTCRSSEGAPESSSHHVVTCARMTPSSCNCRQATRLDDMRARKATTTSLCVAAASIEGASAHRLQPLRNNAKACSLKFWNCASLDIASTTARTPMCSASSLLPDSLAARARGASKPTGAVVHEVVAGGLKLGGCGPHMLAIRGGSDEARAAGSSACLRLPSEHRALRAKVA
mmetsp:Transcript_111249/g.321667  ORF Transcript_111249/g.321667 Transcript_111249/m.321667 type:complete len:231 (+) Transcript_111249:574-1266(+)